MVRRAAIVAPVRTPVAKYLGALKDVPAETLAAHVVRAVVSRSGIDPSRIDDVVFAQSYANSEAPCIGRWAALAADLPIEVPGLQIDRRCGGGLQAIVTAAMMVETGAADVVIAGGVESMSNIEYYTTAMRSGARAGNVTMYDRLERGRERSQPVERFGVISGMIETAENVARECQITREASDAFAVESHRRAARAWAEGKFADEVVAVSVPQRKGDPVMVVRDEGFRTDSTVEALAALKPIMKGGVVTAANSSQQNDAAAACLIVAEDKLASLGLEPMGMLVGWAAAGCHPATMGLGPGACGREVVRAVEAVVEGHRSRRVERGVRGAGAGRDEALGLGRSREAQRQRVGHFTRASDRGDGCPHSGDAASRDEAAEGALWAGDDVRRRRTGCRGGVRAGLRFSCAIAQWTLGFTTKTPRH